MKSRLAILMLVAAASAVAQTSSGYIFFAPGGATANGYTSTTLHAGGGADIHLVKGIGFNAELGALAPKDDLYSTVGIFSLGGTYRFRRGENIRLEPFAAGGYSLMFRESHANLYYFGGGVTCWAARRVGVRVEFRDHVWPGEPVHFWGFRFGVAFR
ncbi:MAG TPA: hypothetical protein VGS58_01810 [Candidatus Sulfopaludibacter sp.]|nr:hypothetical protein [Candidatus Sulfopaludibacter sp.]